VEGVANDVLTRELSTIPRQVKLASKKRWRFNVINGWRVRRCNQPSLMKE